VGRVRLSYLLRPDGMLLGEATIARLDEDRFLLLGPTAARERDLDHLQRLASRNGSGDGAVEVRHGTGRTSTLMVMGPRSRELLGRLSDDDLSAAAAPWMSVREVTVAGAPATALRVSFVGELGWELHLDDRHLVDVYGALRGAGDDLGLVDFGSHALNAMRVEKGYHGWQSDFGDEYTPFDAGLGRFVALDHPAKGDFVGRDAVLAHRERPADWAWATFTLDLSGLPGRPADPAPSAAILHDGRWAGYVTSASPGFRTGTRVCLGYVEGTFADARDGFSVDVLGTPCPATRHVHGVYDPDHQRPRS